MNKVTENSPKEILSEIKFFARRNAPILMALLVLLIYLSPNIFFPNKARFVIHDNLDSNIVWYKNLAESGKMFASNNEIVPNSLGGIPRGCYPSQFNFNHSLYLFFSPLTAYNINIIFTHLAAFFCMFVLLRAYILKDEKRWITTSIALMFALLPFWPAGGTTIATQPLLLFALLNILNNDLRIKNWLIVAIIPFFTILIHSNFFFLILMFGYGLYVFFLKKRINIYFVVALILYTIVTVFCEYRLFAMQFLQHFESHRSGVNSLGTLNFNGVIGVSVMHFLKGQYHFYSLQFPFIILVSLVAISVAKYKKERANLLLLLSLVYLVSLMFVLPNWNMLSAFLSKYNLVNAVSLRFYSLAPLLWFLILAYSVTVITKNSRVALKILPYFFLAFGLSTCLALFEGDYFGSKYAENSFYRTYFRNETDVCASFDEYYKPHDFEKIKKQIPPGNFYVACIGIRPEVLQYNGYYTIDGYFFYYPKKCSVFMNEVCSKEYAKTNYQGVNSRCYVWSDDVNKNKTVLDSLDLDYDKLLSANTKYIFSSYKIQNLRLISEKVFKSEFEDTSIFTYSIN